LNQTTHGRVKRFVDACRRAPTDAGDEQVRPDKRGERAPKPGEWAGYADFNRENCGQIKKAYSPLRKPPLSWSGLARC
jgi:hypothetical protein